MRSVFSSSRNKCSIVKATGLVELFLIKGHPSSFLRFGFLCWDPRFVDVPGRPSCSLGAVTESRKRRGWDRVQMPKIVCWPVLLGGFRPAETAAAWTKAETLVLHYRPRHCCRWCFRHLQWCPNRKISKEDLVVAIDNFFEKNIPQTYMMIELSMQFTWWPSISHGTP